MKIDRWQPIEQAENGKGRSLSLSANLSANGLDIPIAGAVPLFIGNRQLQGTAGS